MKEQNIIDMIEFQGKELRDIIEHSVILGASKIADSISKLEDIPELLDIINNSFKNIDSRLYAIEVAITDLYL